MTATVPVYRYAWEASGHDPLIAVDLVIELIRCGIVTADRRGVQPAPVFTKAAA